MKFHERDFLVFFGPESRVQQCNFHRQVMLRAPEELVPEVGISALSAGASLPRDAEAGGLGTIVSELLGLIQTWMSCEMFKSMMCWIVTQQYGCCINSLKKR